MNLQCSRGEHKSHEILPTLYTHAQSCTPTPPILILLSIACVHEHWKCDISHCLIATSKCPTIPYYMYKIESNITFTTHMGHGHSFHFLHVHVHVWHLHHACTCCTVYTVYKISQLCTHVHVAGVPEAYKLMYSHRKVWQKMAT